MKRLLQYFVLVCLSLSGIAFADSSNSNVHQFKLKNGLTLIVKQDNRAPVVVTQVWYRVGSSYEYGGITGISHVLEHMMFRGSKKHAPGEFSRIIADNGGIENAFTYYDYTAYYQILAADKLPISFKLEADRMKNLTLDPKIFDKEIQVVMEERRMRVEDNPQSLTRERFLAAAHVKNPYHHPVIGWMNDLQHLNVNDLRKWYQQWYVPNNAIVVVVGDVKPKKVLALAKKYFGPLTSEKLPEIKPQKAVKPIGERHVLVEAPARVAWLIMGYNVPSLTTAKHEWKPYALSVIAGILDGGNSSRIPRELIRGQQVAASAGVSYSIDSRLSSLFVFGGNPAKDHDVAQLQQAFMQQIKQLKDKPVTKQELERVKAQVIAGKIYQKDSLSSQANEIGSLESVGLSWKVGDEFVKRIEAITPEQIQQVAREYFVPKRLTVAQLKPLPIAGGSNVH